MALYIRMILYFVSALIAGQGVAVFDATAGTLTIDLKSVEAAAGGFLTFVGTFIAGRVAKSKGGAT